MKDKIKCSKSLTICIIVLLAYIFSIVNGIFVLEHAPSFWRITIGASSIVITLAATVCCILYWKGYKSLLGDFSKAQKQIMLDKEKDNHIADLESRLEEADDQIKGLKAAINETQYPLEKCLNPILAFLNDVYLECEEYGEQYALHIKKRVEHILKNQGYEYVDYSEDTIDYYSTFKSNYDTDTVTQPALVNKKTQRCVIGGIVFLKGEK